MPAWLFLWKHLETHVNKVGFSFGPEVPLHGGGAVHLAALLTGDAAQLEALPRHRLRVRVHLCTGAVATQHCQRQASQTLQPERRAPTCTGRSAAAVGQLAASEPTEAAGLTKERAEQRRQQQLHGPPLTRTPDASESTTFGPASGPDQPHAAGPRCGITPVEKLHTKPSGGSRCRAVAHSGELR